MLSSFVCYISICFQPVNFSDSIKIQWIQWYDLKHCDPDQMASSEARLSGSTVFSIRIYLGTGEARV